MSRTQTVIYRSPPARYFSRKAQTIVLPGLHGTSLFELGKIFFDELKASRLRERAAAVTYNFLMAMPPTFLILFSLLPYLPLDNVEQTFLSVIKLLAPNRNIYNNIHGIVLDFMNTRHHEVLGYGVILVLYFSSNGIMGLMRSFDKSLPVYIKRPPWRRRWTAVKLTVVILGVVILGLATLIYQKTDLNPLIHRQFKGIIAVKTLSFFILAMLVFLTISIIYTYGPSLKHRFRFISAGSVFATTGTVIATAIFFFLVNNFINYNKVYGSIGTLIAFMVWVWLNTIIILLGYELNVSILLGKLAKQENNARG